MSTASAEPDDNGKPVHTRAVWQRGMAALVLALAIVALFRVEIARVDDDLLLTAPEEAFAGSSVPVRVHVLRHVTAPEGPVLGSARVRVRLCDLSGRELDTTIAVGDPRLGLVAHVQIAAAARGTLRLDAWEVAADDPATRAPGGSVLRVSRALAIVSEAHARRVPREALPLQRGALGRLRSEPPGVAPVPFLPRVLGAVCVPGEVCDLALWIGSEPAVATLEAGAGVQLLRGFPGDARAGLVRAALRVEGPEAELTLRATRAGQRVASRSMRLPVGLGRPSVGEPKLVPTRHGTRLEADVVLPPGRRRGIADAFIGGAWVESVDVASPRSRLAIALPRVPEGEVWLQVRTDAFGSEGAAARRLFVGERALQLAAEDGLDRGASGGMSDGSAALAGLLSEDPDLAAQFVAAAREDEAILVPAPARARPGMVAQLDRGRLHVRWAFALAVACGALVAALWLGRRGLGAASEAAAVLSELSDGARRPSSGERLEVLAWALLVALAFAAAALLIVAKPLWF